MSNDINIVRVGSILSVSRKITLSYEIGHNKQCDIFIRIVKSTGNGIYNRNWQALSHLETILALDNETITANTLKSKIFASMSSNMSSYFAAILLNEGILKTSDDKPGSYRVGDLSKFKKGIQALIDAGTSLNEAPIPDKGKVMKSKKDAPKKIVASKDKK